MVNSKATGKSRVEAALKVRSKLKASATKTTLAKSAVKGTHKSATKKRRTSEGAAEAKAAAKISFETWKSFQIGMTEKWPAPAYMALKEGRSSHTSYYNETYEHITRWMAETKIQYRPHAKSPGSKSHLRYEKYSKARTVGDALKLGSWPVDWCWDFERGFIKVLGPVRNEPVDISKVTDEKTLTPVDLAIYRWYRRELARNLGLDYKDLSVGKGSGESTLIRAHRLVAQREATKRLQAAAKAKRWITDDEVEKTLKEWAFGRNPHRVNVLPDGKDWVWSDTLGLLRDRTGDIHLTSATLRYPAVAELICKYLTDRLPRECKDFKFTSLNLNANYAAKRHRDGNNFGPSFIKAFGGFTGGELNYWPEDDRKADKMEDLKDDNKVSLDIKHGLALFNGNCAHSVNDFTGNRFSVVYFTVACFDQAPLECKDQLRNLGFLYPDGSENRYSILRAPLGYSSVKSGASAAKMSAPFKYYPDSSISLKKHNFGA